MWTVPREFPGETVFIVGGGPSVTQADVDRLKGQRVIVVNSSFEKAPWADFLFFGDSRWWWDHREAIRANFKGRIVTVCQHTPGKELLRLKKAAPPGLSSDPRALALHRTSISGATNLAVHLGAKTIAWLGVDNRPAPDGRTHHHKPHRWPLQKDCFADQAAELLALRKPLKRLGVTVFNCSPDSALPKFTKASLDDVLAAASSLSCAAPE